MRVLIKFLIQIYWKTIPTSMRRKCLYKESCSRIVYRYADERGFNSAIKIFCHRYNNCRDGYHLFLKDGKIHVLTVRNTTIKPEHINPNITCK